MLVSTHNALWSSIQRIHAVYMPAESSNKELRKIYEFFNVKIHTIPDALFWVVTSHCLYRNALIFHTNRPSRTLLHNFAFLIHRRKTLPLVLRWWHTRTTQIIVTSLNRLILIFTSLRTSSPACHIVFHHCA
jgi:hypothetical protein